jgi:hypothetical protein
MGALRSGEQPTDEPVALETAVVATGARPGNAGSKRELFTEETQTVLVFEKGAVIRLSAAVADGQLLFLTNKKTGREVVTQVVRKRSFRPTSCYVDLEFTEASPGFWDIELPKSAPAMPSQSAATSGEDGEGGSAKHAAPPSLQEVERLKKEVAELQTQLKTLTDGSPRTDVSAEGAAVTGAATTPNGDAARQNEEKILTQLLAQAAQQEKLHGPQRLVAYPKKNTTSAVKTVGKLATAGAFAAVIVAAGVAVYRFGLLDSWIGKSAAAEPVSSHASTIANPGTSATPRTTGGTSSANTTPLGSRAAVSAEGLAPVQNKGGGEAPSAADSLKVPPVVANATQLDFGTATKPTYVVPKETKRPSTATQSFAARSAGPTAPVGNSTGNVAESSGVVGSEGEYVGPKLVRAVKPVSPPEALRNYVTGSVNVDALVDVTGHVKSVTVISGPKKLWNTAIEQMKQYVYEPARKNGKPVMSHVQTSLQYWYEP